MLLGTWHVRVDLRVANQQKITTAARTLQISIRTSQQQQHEGWMRAKCLSVALGTSESTFALQIIRRSQQRHERCESTSERYDNNAKGWMRARCLCLAPGTAESTFALQIITITAAARALRSASEQSRRWYEGWDHSNIPCSNLSSIQHNPSTTACGCQHLGG